MATVLPAGYTQIQSATSEDVKNGLSNGLYKWNGSQERPVDGRSIQLLTTSDLFKATQSGWLATFFARVRGVASAPVENNMNLNIGDCILFVRGGDTPESRILYGKITSFGFVKPEIPPGMITVELYRSENKTFHQETEIKVYEVPTVRKTNCPCDCTAVLEKYKRGHRSPSRRGGKGSDVYEQELIIEGGSSYLRRWREALRTFYKGDVPVPGPKKGSKEYMSIRRIYERLH